MLRLWDVAGRRLIGIVQIPLLHFVYGAGCGRSDWPVLAGDKGSGVHLALIGYASAWIMG